MRRLPPPQLTDSLAMAVPRSLPLPAALFALITALLAAAVLLACVAAPAAAQEAPICKKRSKTYSGKDEKIKLGKGND